MSKVIFNLKEPDKRILRYLASEGPMNLSELERHTEKYMDRMKRWSLNKHLHGSTRFFGLVPYEYVTVKKKNEKESKYELTTKGVLATLTHKPLEKNYTFQKYVNYVGNNFSEEIKIFIKNFVYEFITLFFQWHYFNGIDLTRLKSSEFYFMHFIESVRLQRTLNITKDQKKNEKEFVKTMKNCIAYTTIIDLMTTGTYFGRHTDLSLANWNKMKSIHKKHNATDQYFLGKFLWEWPLMIGKESHTEVFSDKDVQLKEFHSYDILKTIHKKLKEINVNTEWKNTLT